MKVDIGDGALRPHTLSAFPPNPGMHALLRGKQMHVVVALAPVWYMTLKKELRSNKQSDISSIDSSINDSSIISRYGIIFHCIGQPD